MNVLDDALSLLLRYLRFVRRIPSLDRVGVYGDSIRDQHLGKDEYRTGALVVPQPVTPRSFDVVPGVRYVCRRRRARRRSWDQTVVGAI